MICSWGDMTFFSCSITHFCIYLSRVLVHRMIYYLISKLSFYDKVSCSQFCIVMAEKDSLHKKCLLSSANVILNSRFWKINQFQNSYLCTLFTRKLSQVLRCYKTCLSRHQDNLKLWWVFSFFGSSCWLLWFSCKHPVTTVLFVILFCSIAYVHIFNPFLFLELDLYICQPPVFYDSSIWSHIPLWSKGE